jgi:hypothetical protein
MAYYNERRWPTFVAGLLSGALILAGERAYHTWVWAGDINRQVLELTPAAKASAAYLSQVIGKTADGKEVRRYQVIDAALQDYISHLQAPKAPANK